MKVLATGTLGAAIAGSGVTGKTAGSGTSTPPINLSGIGQSDRVGVWLSVEGNFGLTTAKVNCFWKGAYTRTGVTYTGFVRGAETSEVTGNYIIKSAHTSSGMFANGTFLKVIQPCMPFIRLEALTTGTGTTNAGILRWAVCVL